MKTPAILILTAILLAAAALHSRLAAIGPARSPAEVSAQSPDVVSTPMFETVIEPGSNIGLLKLGDSRTRALQLFPKKDEDQEWADACGTTLYWEDSTNRDRGDVTIRLKKDKVFQIESSTTRFHTAEGITTFDPPEKIKNSYKDMQAYTLLTAPTPALGDRPLVYWIDKKKGIAFVFAYYPAKHKRYVYKIVVFVPGKTFCPESETTSSPKWQEINSYALEPPAELAPNRE